MAECPNAIFKYVGPDRIDILTNLKIRFTQPSCCNDPFEAQPCIDGLDDETLLKQQMEKIDRAHYRGYILRRNPANGARPLSFEEFQKRCGLDYDAAVKALKADPVGTRQNAAEKTRTFWDSLGLLSLTATENNLLMWAHYTDGHRGMVLELDPEHPFLKPPDCEHPNPPEKKQDIQFGEMTPVFYSTDRPSRRLGDQLRTTDFFVKSPEWEYEHEWRVVQLLANSASQKQSPTGTVHLFSVSPECIRRVIIGCCMEQATRTKLLNTISGNPDLRHVQVDEAKLDLDTFRLNYVSYPRP